MRAAVLRSLLCALCVLLFNLLLASPLPAAEGRPPNIVFILADDLGYGDLGCYGQKRIKTPHIDRLAQDGMRFTDFYAGATVCAPSRCVLMTGYHLGHCWVRGNAGQGNREIQCLRDQDVTVAEVLRKAGYATALCGKWGLGEEGTAGVPTRQGFDHFFGYLNQHHAHNYYPAYLFRGEERVPLANVVPGSGEFGDGVASKKVAYSSDLITAEALKWIDEVKDRPFFLYYAVTLPHANNEGGKQGMEVPDLGQYAATDWPPQQQAHAAMISRLDADVGRLMDKLQALGQGDNTLVCFSSDNGPHAEGGNDPQFNDSNGPLRGIKRDLTEGGIRVPLIARWPEKIKAGATSDHVGSFADLLPTLAEFAGNTSDLPTDLDGLSIGPTLLGRPAEQKQHDFLYWAFYERGGAQAVRKGKWKGVQQPLNTPLRLYDLSVDLGEDRDLAADHPEVVSRLTAALHEAYVPSANWKFPDPAAPSKKNRAEGAGQLTMRRYSHSGIVPLAGAISTVLAALSFAAIGGILYAFTAYWLSGWAIMRLILMVAYALMVGIVIAVAANRGKIRSPLFTTVIALIAAALGLWVYWGAYDVARNGLAVAPTAWTPAGLKRSGDDLFDNGSFTMKRKQKAKGWLLVAVWIVEACAVTGIVVVMARDDASRPFCETCQEWTKSERGLMRLAADGKEPAWQEVLAGDLPALAVFERALSTTSPQVRLDLARCPKCEHSNFVTLTAVTITKDKKGNDKTTERSLMVNGAITDPEAVFLAEFAKQISGPLEDDDEDDDDENQGERGA